MVNDMGELFNNDLYHDSVLYNPSAIVLANSQLFHSCTSGDELQGASYVDRHPASSINAMDDSLQHSASSLATNCDPTSTGSGPLAANGLRATSNSNMVCDSSAASDSVDYNWHYATSSLATNRGRASARSAGFVSGYPVARGASSGSASRPSTATSCRA